MLKSSCGGVGGVEGISLAPTPRVGTRSSEPPAPRARAWLISVSCSSRRSPRLRGDEHRHRQHRHGFRSQHGECRPSPGLSPSPCPTVWAHSTGPEASSDGAELPWPTEGAALREPAPSSCGSLHPPGVRGGRRGVAGVGAVRRAHPSCGRKGSWAGLALGFRRSPRAPSSSSGLSPGPEVSQVPSRLLSNRRWGAGEERRVVGVVHILGKRYLRFPLLSFGKRCWQLKRTRGSGLCILGCFRSVSSVSVGSLKSISLAVNPGTPLLQSLSEVLTELWRL